MSDGIGLSGYAPLTRPTMLNKAGKKSLESEEHRFMAIARQLVVVGTVLATVAGCATASRQSWMKPGASADDLARDRYACIQESRVPYDTSFGSAGFSSSGGGAGWGSRASVAQGGSDGGFMPLGATRRAQTEANRIFDACMEARGWRGSN